MGRPIVLHKPHPGNIVKQYALRQVMEELPLKGYIKYEHYEISQTLDSRVAAML